MAGSLPVSPEGVIVTTCAPGARGRRDWTLTLVHIDAVSTIASGTGAICTFIIAAPDPVNNRPALQLLTVADIALGNGVSDVVWRLSAIRA